MWLANLFNKILRLKKMPHEQRKSTLVPIYHYKGIELMAHIMAHWERVTKFELRKEICISNNHVGFTTGRSNLETIPVTKIGRKIDGFQKICKWPL